MDARKLLALLLVAIGVAISSKVYAVICTNTTINNVTYYVCYAPGTYVENNTNNMNYMFTAYSSTYKETNTNTLSYLYTVLTSTFQEWNNNTLSYLYKVASSILSEVNINPRYGNVTGNITILNTNNTLTYGWGVVKYRIKVPWVYPEGEYLEIIAYVNGTIAGKKIYTNFQPNSIITDNITIRVDKLGSVYVLLEYYEVSKSTGYMSLIGKDWKVFNVSFTPFYIKIISPTNTTYNTNTIDVKYDFATPYSTNFTYIIRTLLYSGANISIDTNTTVPAGVYGNLTYTLTVPNGNYRLVAILSAIENNETLFKTQDSVNFSVSVVTPPPTTPSTGAPTTTVTQVNITQPNVTTTNISYPIQTTIPPPTEEVWYKKVSQYFWILFIIMGLIALYYYYRTRSI